MNRQITELIRLLHQVDGVVQACIATAQALQSTGGYEGSEPRWQPTPGFGSGQAPVQFQTALQDAQNALQRLASSVQNTNPRQ